MKFLNIVFFGFVSFLIVGCGAAPAEADSDDNSINIEINGEKIRIDGDDGKNITEAINKTKDAFNDVLSDGKQDGETTEVVNWRELKDLLPNKMGGLRLDSENIEGQTTSLMGFKFSSVE